MNRSDLIARMTDRLGGDRASAVAAVTGVLEEIEAGVARGERVTLTGFGTFERRARAARTARNPRTGEAVRVEASVVPVFRAATGFKGLLTHPDGAQQKPAARTRDAQGGTGTRLQVLDPSSADGSTKKARKAAKQATEKVGKRDGKEKAGKKARKAKSKAAKKSA